MTAKFKYLVFIFCAVIITSCKISQKTTLPRNLERIYDPSGSTIHPRIKIYSISDTSSLFVERLFTKELLYNQANSEKELMARVKVIYYLYDLDDKQNLTDSSTTTFKFRKNTDKTYETIEIPVLAKKGNHYLLEVITIDQNRKNNHYSFKAIDRKRDISEQDFLITDQIGSEYFINSYISNNKEFKVNHYKNNYDSLLVLYYPNKFTIPLPPYEPDTLNESFEHADTSWTCYLDSIQYSNFEKEGIYFFTTSFNGDLYEGFPLFNFGEVFPVVRTPEDLAKPLKYLGGFDSIPNSDSTGKLTKLAVDNFWLDKANNIDKSRELLKAYYNRVMLANKYFTSYKEGWQTDRGMIYIIYGLPDYLYKSGEEERWIYNPAGVGTGITFTFNYNENPFSLNHYLLDREKLKATGWDDAVKLWNKGEIFYFQR